MSETSRAPAGAALATRLGARALLLLMILLMVTTVGEARQATEELAEASFTLKKDGSSDTLFPVDALGRLVASVSVRDPFPATPVSLRLEGPDGTVAEKTGTAPLSLHYHVHLPEQIGRWRLTVVNTSKMGGVKGRLSAALRPRTKEAQAAAEARRSSPVTDGRLVPAPASASRQLRVSCRDRNRDVTLDIDLDAVEATLSLSFNPLVTLTPRQVDERLIELRGSGAHPLVLDLESQVLRFDRGEAGTFCRVNIFPR